MTDRVFDLDAARVARWEAMGLEASVIHGGRTWRLTPELPLQFTVLAMRDDLEGMLRLILVDPEEASEFLSHGFFVEDLKGLLTNVYGVGLGESEASPPSSGNGGKRSRQTSKPITTST